jgi:hypothetical protein
MPRRDIPQSLWLIYRDACRNIGDFESDRMRVAVLGLIGAFECDARQLGAPLTGHSDGEASSTDSILR